MKQILITIFISLFSSFSFAQGTAGEDAKYEYRYLIDMPSSGILDKGFVNVGSDVLPNGVVITKLEVGAFDGVSFGISYGGENIIGSGSPRWYKYPGVNLRFRLMEETLNFPALSIGFDSQGKGIFFDSSNRFEIKSPGFFVSGSKNFEMLGYLSIHGSLNYSLESKDGDNFLNLMLGVEKTIGKKVSINMEYNFAFNDNADKLYGKTNGYLNLGVRWSVGDGLTLGLDLRDLLSNKKWSPGSADRGIKIEFIKNIF
jgi:hypothetical protein